jgi:hypothetical protein
MRKVRITGLPNKKDGGQGHQTQGQGIRRFMDDTRSYDRDLNPFAAPDVQVNRTIQPVDRANADIEAEKNEVAFVPGMGGIPETYIVGGKRHADGGTPLKLGEGSFIYSDNKSNKFGMKIKDKELLKDEFGMTIPKKGFRGYTPAEIAKKYDINKQKQILMDPNSDKIERETAEMNIENFNLKLGKLALIQESMKGFPQGAPKAAEGYMTTVGMDPKMFEQPQGNPMEQGQPQMASYGGSMDTYQRGGQYDSAFWNSIMKDGGNVPYAQDGLSIKEQMDNKRYDRFMRKNPGMEWSPIPEPPVVDPVQAAVIAQQGTPQPVVTPGATTTTTETTDDTKPVASKKPTYTYNVPDKYRDNDVYNTESESYDSSVIKEGDYIKKADGKWYKATGLQPIHGTYKGDDMATTFGNNADVAGAYAYLQSTFEDPDVRAAYAEKTRAALKNKEYYKGKSGGYSDMYTEAEIAKLTDDDLVEQFLKHQKRNYALQANGVDPEDFKDADGNLRSASDLANVMAKRTKADGTLAYPTPEAARAEADRRLADYKTRNISSLNSAFDNYGIGITDEEIAAGDLGVEQASYWGYHDLIKDREKLSPELQTKLQHLTEPQEGFSDEPGTGTISPIDSKSKNFYTNTTAGQLSVVEGEEMAYEEAALAEKDKEPIMMVNPWAQDVMNLGNLVNTSLSRKKYLPHSYPVDFANPDVLYHDPARAVATTNEQSGMARRANTAFAGPNATYRNTGIAGKTWAKNLDTIGQYENMNVPIGNQYYDKVWEADRIQTMSNDNTKVADRRNITDAKIQMLTNMMETQAWNQQFPNLNTKPGIGGGMWSTGYNRPFVNTGMPGQSNSYVSQFQTLKQQYPEASDRAIENQLSMQYGTPQGRRAPSPYNQQDAERAAFAAQYGAINPMAYPG